MKNYQKSRLFYIFCLFLLFIASCGKIELGNAKKIKPKPEDTSTGLKIAIAPGGGVNAYTSLYLAKKFAKGTGKGIFDMFDQFWGLSGGSIVASMLMTKWQNRESDAVDDFKTIVQASYNNVKPLIEQMRDKNNTLTDAQKTDQDGARRDLFTNELSKYFSGNTGVPGLVILASTTDNKPVYYCDSSLSLPDDALRSHSTSLVDAITNSSNFQPGLAVGKKGKEGKGGLFKVVQDTLTIKEKKNEVESIIDKNYEVIDGFHALNSYNSPLGFAIEYLQTQKPGDNTPHKIVFFDNGSNVNAQDYRMKAFKKGNNGFYKIVDPQTGIVIELYYLKVYDPNFGANTANIEDNSFLQREKLVDDIIDKEYFINAVDAFK